MQHKHKYSLQKTALIRRFKFIDLEEKIRGNMYASATKNTSVFLNENVNFFARE